MSCRHLFILAALVALGTSTLRSAEDDFAAGMRALDAGDFAEAAARFEREGRDKPSSGVFLNLGIAEWRRGHAGLAMLAWEKSAWIDPFDSRAGDNLKFARAMAQVDEPSLRWFEKVSCWLPANWWVLLAGASLWLAVAALVLPRFFRRPKSGWQQWLAALGAGAFLLCLAGNAGVLGRTQLGFVIKREAALRLVPAENSEVTAMLTGGEPLRCLKTRGEFYLVRTGHGIGWIRGREAGWLNAPR